MFRHGKNQTGLLNPLTNLENLNLVQWFCVKRVKTPVLGTLAPRRRDLDVTPAPARDSEPVPAVMLSEGGGWSRSN